MNEAAVIILLRRGPERGYRVCLVRRRTGASFMASAYVFPGGGIDQDDPGGDPRFSAARELLEEAGVLLASPAPSSALACELRAATLAGSPMTELLATHGLTFALDKLLPWSHWITPSVEPRRFSARFFIAECPPEQTASCDQHETTDLLWVTPSEAVVRAGELSLPPPQLLTFWQMMRMPTVDEVLAQAQAWEGTIQPILPCVGVDSRGPCLLLPWDPDYQLADGDSRMLTGAAPWAHGKSRFVRNADGWQLVHPLRLE